MERPQPSAAHRSFLSFSIRYSTTCGRRAAAGWLGRQGRFRRQARLRLTIRALMEMSKVMDARLRVEEAIAAYQYTGPLFQVNMTGGRTRPYARIYERSCECVSVSQWVGVCAHVHSCGHACVHARDAVWISEPTRGRACVRVSCK